MSQILLADMAWSKVPPATTAKYGYKGVLLYVSRDLSKCGTRADVDGYHAVHMGVGWVYEDSARRALGGYAAGLADGQYAANYLRGLGMPAGLPVYVAVDFAPTPAEMPTVLAYMDGFVAGLRPFYEGRVYGDKTVIDAMVAHGIPDDWQTCAWSGGVVDDKAALYQRLKPTTGMPGSYDEDVVLGSLDAVGLWMPPAPAPVPAPVAPITPSPLEEDVIWLLKDPDSPAQYVGINGGWYHVPTVPDLVEEQNDGAKYVPVPDDIARVIVARINAAQ